MSFTRQIPPGGEGKIEIKVNTANYGGKPIQKTIGVVSNDPEQKRITLTIKGEVEKFFTMTPPQIRLRGDAGTKIETSVKIVPEKSHPFKIQAVKAQEGKNFKWHLQPNQSKDGVEYDLIVENSQNEPGRYMDKLIVTTDHSEYPEIEIGVFGQILKPNDQKNGTPEGSKNAIKG